jgi:hypothetical protein
MEIHKTIKIQLDQQTYEFYKSMASLMERPIEEVLSDALSVYFGILERESEKLIEPEMEHILPFH